MKQALTFPSSCQLAPGLPHGLPPPEGPQAPRIMAQCRRSGGNRQRQGAPLCLVLALGSQGA